MRYEAVAIVSTLELHLQAMIKQSQDAGMIGTPVQFYGFITDAIAVPDSDELELTIDPGGKTWVLRPEEVAPIPATSKSAGKHRTVNGRTPADMLLNRLSAERSCSDDTATQ